MPDREQLLLDSTSLLKHDPQVAETIVSPPQAGSRTATKLKSLGRLVRDLVPANSAAPPDPFGYLQKAIPVAMSGKNRRGVSLDALADRTNPHDPLLQAYFALRTMAHAIHDIGEYRLMPLGVGDWSPDQALAIGDPPPRPRRAWTALGYRVDAEVMLEAAADLAAIEQQLGSADPRRPVIMASLALVNAALWQLRYLLRAAGNMLVELRWVEREAGQFTVAFVPRQGAESDPDPDPDPASSPALGAAPLKLNELQEFMAVVETILDARSDDDGDELEARSAVMHEARAQSPALYDWATRKHGVGDVHLAVIDRVQRKYAAVPKASTEPARPADAEEPK